MSSTFSVVCDAMDTVVLRIESQTTNGFAGVQLIGNAADVCRDGKERARVALDAVGVQLPPHRIIISMAPAEVRKDGSHLDLPLAVSLAFVGASTAETRACTERWVFAAELGLDGTLRPVRGIVPITVAAVRHGFEGVVVARDNLAEIRTLQGFDVEALRTLKVRAFDRLGDVLQWVRGRPMSTVEMLDEIHEECATSTPASLTTHGGPCFDDMVLSSEQELLAVVAATGLHSVLLRGTPGCGKSMFAARLPSILPRMEVSEHLEALRIHSLCRDRLSPALLSGRPPFRAPHHHASAAALLGTAERPGEISLAHGGVLFLDELPEFRRDLLEGMREPLESGEVHVARSRGKIQWHARVLLIGACNDCPCGWYLSARRRCRCGSSSVMAYHQRLSGPVLDRIDIHFRMPEPRQTGAQFFLALARQDGDSVTARLADRVLGTRDVSLARNRVILGERSGTTFNRDLQLEHLEAASGLTQSAFGELINAVIPSGASPRTILRSLRVARTLADTRGDAAIAAGDLKLAWSWQATAEVDDDGLEPSAASRGGRVDR